ncbi:twin-arginine translocation signal domain-containing protein, partial [bacterium]|nr:twin-arginine translocation signal domain-containing protein [bacterium]
MGGESPLTKPDGVSETPGDRRPGISRRSFLQLGAALGGAAVVGVPALAAAAPALATGAAHGTTGAMGM